MNPDSSYSDDRQDNAPLLVDRPKKSPKGLFGYIYRHWKGELPLALAFWVNLVGINLLFRLVITATNKSSQLDTLLAVRATIIIGVISIIIIYPWQLIGVWRSANRRVARTGKHGWAWLAKAALVFGVGITGLTMTNQWELLRDTAKIGFGESPFGEYTVSLTPNGEAIHLIGPFSYGLTDEIESLLSESPKVKAIILDSQGGAILEGRALANLILRYGLSTYSTYGCYSACTIAFMGGIQRYLTFGANLAFHQYHNPYPGFRGRWDRELEQQKDKIFFHRQGVHSEFIEKMFQATADDLWVPTIEELKKGNVITAMADRSLILPEDYEERDDSAIRQTLLKKPMFVALKKYQPERFDHFAEEMGKVAESGGDFSEIKKIMDKEVGLLRKEALTTSTDQALINYTLVEIGIMRTLVNKNPILCLKYLYPDRYGVVSLTGHLDEMKWADYMTQFNKVLIESFQNPTHDIDANAAENLHLKIKNKMGQQVKDLEMRTLKNSIDYTRHCTAYIRFMELVITHSNREAGNYIRYLYSDDTYRDNQIDKENTVDDRIVKYSRQEITDKDIRKKALEKVLRERDSSNTLEKIKKKIKSEQERLISRTLPVDINTEANIEENRKVEITRILPERTSRPTRDKVPITRDNNPITYRPSFQDDDSSMEEGDK